jgi:hypothetical protein
MAGKFTRYEQAPVSMTIGAGGVCNMLATTVTVGENLPLQAVRALGYNGAVAVTANGPVDGTWSVTYHLVKNAGANCGDATSYDASGCTAFYSPDESGSNWVLSKGFADADKLSMKIGEVEMFTKGIANSFNVTAEPNAIITATLGGNFYDCRMKPDAGAFGGDATSAKAGEGDLNVAHGSESGADASALGFGCDPFNATYEASRGFNPIYTLGNLSAVMVMVTDPQQSISMQGEDLPKGVIGNCDSASDTPLCLTPNSIDFNIGDVCGNSIATYGICGHIQSRDVEVAENDVLRGNISIVDYTMKQDVGAKAECS